MDEPNDSRAALADAIDLAGRRVMTGMVIAGAAIGLAVYSRPGPPRYEVDVAGSTVIRTNVRSGTVLACEGQRCYVVVERGQDLEGGPVPAEKALPAPPPEQPKALPAADAAPTPSNAQ